MRFHGAASAVSCVSATTCVAGGLYAGVFHFVPLQSIDLDMSTNIVVAGILGGAGSPYGALLGAAVFIVLSDSLSHVWAHWPLLFGILVIVPPQIRPMPSRSACTIFLITEFNV